ncbi:MAG: dTMP kinase [Chloroflexi bacterium]|nr:dTMP kinase [Chloroflexota bacterium]
MSIFVTLEGPEGSGKSTQARYLRNDLQARGCSVILTREPGGTSIGEKIRGVLLDIGNSEISPVTEALLYLASRSQLVEEVLRPALSSKDVVICDRYADSTLAYQGFGHGLNLDELRAVNFLATGGLEPDLTFCLDLPVETGLQRRRRALESLLQNGRQGEPEDGVEWNRLDAKEVEFHRRVRMGYLELAALNPERWVVVDALLPEQDLRGQIREIVLRRLKRESTMRS